MSCACGHHHPAPADLSGRTVSLSRPLVALRGRLICHDMGQMMTALDMLPDHRTLSRAEPGCLHFDIRQDDDPMIWHLDELFADADAFAAHQARNAASDWGRASVGLGRDFHSEDCHPAIRPEIAADADALDAFLTRAFGGPAEARLVRDLRQAGDLALSLVAQANGVIVGHVALSPLQADGPAFALAPLAVHPALHGRGLGRALIGSALAAAGGPVVVLGDPGVYAGSGFVPADLASPYGGPHLLIHGDLAPGSAIAHAPAFAAP